MAVRIRLARHGKKNYPYYHIVAADSRSPRDGRFIEKLGTYNPNTNPATVEVKSDRALYWLSVGALPTDTCRALLSSKGVLLKKHLLEGVKKGALTEEVAEERFNAWMAERESKVQAKKEQLKQNLSSEQKSRLEAESKVKEAKEAALAKKRIEAAEAAAAAKASENAESGAAEPAEA
jgi:small subunit ribosomal protein S16